MRRNVSLEEISDGKLYGSNDMVKADCQDCKGCCDCCTGRGDSVIQMCIRDRRYLDRKR